MSRRDKIQPERIMDYDFIFDLRTSQDKEEAFLLVVGLSNIQGLISPTLPYYLTLPLSRACNHPTNPWNSLAALAYRPPRFPGTKVGQGQTHSPSSSRFLFNPVIGESCA